MPDVSPLINAIGLAPHPFTAHSRAHTPRMIASARNIRAVFSKEDTWVWKI